MVLQERLVHLLDERVGAEELLVVLAGDGQEDLGEGGPRGRDAGVPEDGEGQGLLQVGRVHDPGVQVERLQAVKPLGFVVPVQVDLEVAFEPAGRHDVAAAPLVPEANVLVGAPVNGQLGVRPRELQAEATALVDVGGRVGLGRVLLGAAELAEAREAAAGRLHPGEVLGRDGQAELPHFGRDEYVVAGGRRLGPGARRQH